MEFVYRQNPWWVFDGWEDKDRELKNFKEADIRWIPSWLSLVSLKPYSLNFIYGVRQTGKTTGVKLIVKRLLGSGLNPWSIFYFDVEGVSTVRELRDILLWYLGERDKHDVKGSYIFLDEVTSVEGWWKVVKFLIDQDFFRKDVVTVLGSSTIGILKSPERFPGRRGRGSTVRVLPLSFPEFIKVHGADPSAILYNGGELSALWEKYVLKGGFPSSINNKETAMEDLIAGITSEIYKHGRSLQITKSILYSLLNKIPSATSYHSIAQDISISHRTVREYIEFLEDCMLLKTAYLKSDRIHYRKEKKFFFRDPFILRTVSNWSLTEFLESALYEGIVQEHLYRSYGEIYYYRDSYEIDCIAGEYKVEVKAGKPHRKYPKKVIVLSKKDIPKFLLSLPTPNKHRNAPCKCKLRQHDNIS